MEDQGWKAVSEVFFRRPAPPGATQTEAFVARVMGRLEEEARSPWRVFLSLRWTAPALGLAAALMFLSISQPEGEALLSEDGFMVADVGDPSDFILEVQ
ncbi:MAG: hypothetical protein AAB320_10700 [Elusimicrobiota bacterium]